jgi:hypothetical protein
MLGIWDVFFSPFGGDRRLWLAAGLVLILVCRIPRAPDDPVPAKTSPERSSLERGAP